MVAERLFTLGVDEVVLGRHHRPGATPSDVARLMGVLVELAPVGALGCRLPSTRGAGAGQRVASLDLGLKHFGCSAGGLRGCPFAGPGAAGNLATEDLVLPARRPRRRPRGEPGQSHRRLAPIVNTVGIR